MNLFNWKLIVTSVLFSGTVLAQEGVVSIQKSLEIDRVLTLKKELNKDRSFLKIQIYSGNRIGAETALESFKTDFPEPDPPTIPVILPSSAWKLRSLCTNFLPNLVVIPFASTG